MKLLNAAGISAFTRIAADGGGNGHVLNRLLMDRLKPTFGLFAILYSAQIMSLARMAA